MSDICFGLPWVNVCIAELKFSHAEVAIRSVVRRLSHYSGGN